MSLWQIAWSYLWSRKLTTVLTIFSVALAVGLISAILTIRDETRKRFEEEQAAFDVVVGPGAGAGSPLQLVLNAIYYLDNPTGLLSYDDYLAVKNHENVKNAYPVALGDSYRQHRIVGTERALFDYDWASIRGEVRSPFVIDEGRFFAAPMEAVIGAQAARATGLEIGAVFVGSHGSRDMTGISTAMHDEHPFEVVGILKPSGTSNDRAIFVDIQSVWDMHPEYEDDEDDEGEHPIEEHDDLHAEHDDAHAGHDHEADDHEDHVKPLGVSAVLVDLESPTQRFQFVGWARDEMKITAAIPYNQILLLYERVLAPAAIILIAVGYVVVVISALSIMIGLYLSIIQRKRDLAIMRALGAAASEIFGAVIIEAFLVTVMGIAAGWVLGKGVALGLGVYLSRNYGLGVHGFGTSPEEWGFFGVVGVVGLLAGVVPAWQAYRTDVARDLTAQ